MPFGLVRDPLARLSHLSNVRLVGGRPEAILHARIPHHHRWNPIASGTPPDMADHTHPAADASRSDPHGREHRYAEAERLKDAGDLPAAVAALEVLVTEDPGYALAHSALAAWCTRLERHEDAVRHARRVCELEPNDPFSFTALSVACMRGGRIAEAEDALARSRMLQGSGR